MQSWQPEKRKKRNTDTQLKENIKKKNKPKQEIIQNKYKDTIIKKLTTNPH